MFKWLERLGHQGRQLCSIRAAAQNMLLWVDFPTAYPAIKNTKYVCLTKNVSVLFLSDTEGEITLHCSNLFPFSVFPFMGVTVLPLTKWKVGGCRRIKVKK